MKPLARWTIGHTLPAGEEILRHSVRRFRNIYPEFDLIVCYNHLTTEQLYRLTSLHVPLHEQKLDESVCPLVPVNAPLGFKDAAPGWGWKLVPPRLRIASHELWIDNDIVIRERIPIIDTWLTTQSTLISMGRYRAYGSFEADITDPTPYCAGFFGLPPGLDFASRILHYYRKLDGPLGYYDEQGITTSVVLERPHLTVPNSDLILVKHLERPFAKGMHFVGANRTIDYKPWETYKCSILM